MIRLLFILLIAVACEARTPKTYASVGDPIYQSVKPAHALRNNIYFSDEREVFNTFISETAAAEKEGFWLDAHRSEPDAKERHDAYLVKLRSLKRQDAMLKSIVKTKMNRAMRTNQSALYTTIKKSGYPELLNDPQLNRQMARYEEYLKEEQMRKLAQNTEAYARYLRSYENLNGEWQSTSPTGRSIVYRFSQKDRILILKQNAGTVQTLEGRWSAENDVLSVALSSITNRSSDGTPHVRKTNVKLRMEIRALDTGKMTLFDTRRKTELTFFRYDLDKSQKSDKEKR